MCATTASLVRPGLTGFLLGILFTLVAPAAIAAERQDPGKIVLAADLRSGPKVSDAVIVTLPAGTLVTILEFAGANARISAGDFKGWVSAAKVRVGDAASGQSVTSGSGGGFLRAMTSLVGGPSGGSDKKVGIGVRGLTPETIEAASPDPKARKRMESYMASREQAQNFARGAGLRARHYAYLSGSTTSSPDSESKSGGTFDGLLKGLTSGSSAGTEVPDASGSER